MDENQHEEIDVTLLYIEEARARADKAIGALRAAGADTGVVAAVERARDELSSTQRRLIQGTLFAVPDAQTSL